MSTPCRVHGFVDLSALPLNFRVDLGEQSLICPGWYAIVERAWFDLDDPEKDTSDILQPLKKEVGKMHKGEVTCPKFFLVDVKDFREEIAVVPNIGGNGNEYFTVLGRSYWGRLFEKWLEADDENEVMSEDEDSE